MVNAFKEEQYCILRVDGEKSPTNSSTLQIQYCDSYSEALNRLVYLKQKPVKTQPIILTLEHKSVILDKFVDWYLFT